VINDLACETTLTVENKWNPEYFFEKNADKSPFVQMGMDNIRLESTGN